MIILNGNNWNPAADAYLDVMDLDQVSTLPEDLLTGNEEIEQIIKEMEELEGGCYEAV